LIRNFFLRRIGNSRLKDISFIYKSILPPMNNEIKIKNSFTGRFNVPRWRGIKEVESIDPKTPMFVQETKP
jgi:hypothetical protein